MQTAPKGGVFFVFFLPLQVSTLLDLKIGEPSRQKASDQWHVRGVPCVGVWFCATVLNNKSKKLLLGTLWCQPNIQVRELYSRRPPGLKLLIWRSFADIIHQCALQCYRQAPLCCVVFCFNHIFPSPILTTCPNWAVILVQWQNTQSYLNSTLLLGPIVFYGVRKRRQPAEIDKAFLGLQDVTSFEKQNWPCWAWLEHSNHTTQTRLPVRIKETTVKQRYVEVKAVLAAENLPLRWIQVSKPNIITALFPILT